MLSMSRRSILRLTGLASAATAMTAGIRRAGAQGPVPDAMRHAAHTMGPVGRVSTEAFEGAPDPDANATVNTATFTEADGRTTLTILVEAPSKAVRDAIIDSGMEAGLQDAMDLLEQTAVSLG